MYSNTPFAKNQLIKNNIGITLRGLKQHTFDNFIQPIAFKLFNFYKFYDF